jgi:hypothetical protein
VWKNRIKAACTWQGEIKGKGNHNRKPGLSDLTEASNEDADHDAGLPTKSLIHVAPNVPREFFGQAWQFCARTVPRPKLPRGPCLK